MTVTTAGERDANAACVDTAGMGGCAEEEEGEVGVAAGEGREAAEIPERGRTGVEREGEGSEGDEGRVRGEVAMSTSAEGEGWMEAVVDCWSLMEEGGAAGAWRGQIGERVRMV